MPKVFHFVFNVVRKFLNETTINKITLHKAGSTKWQQRLLEHCDADQVPAHFGGTQTDPDGNPLCTQKICYGGKVPTDWYMANCTESDNPNAIAPEDFVDAQVKKGGSIRLQFACTAANRVLRWEFRTVDHDIRFGVRYVNDRTGEETVEVELGRVSSHQLDEVGFVACQPGCTYHVIFDNSYSYFTAKRIRYAVQMVEDTIDEVEAACADAEEQCGGSGEVASSSSGVMKQSNGAPTAVNC